MVLRGSVLFRLLDGPARNTKRGGKNWSVMATDVTSANAGVIFTS
jgi:hypothetical protein